MYWVVQLKSNGKVHFIHVLPFLLAKKWDRSEDICFRSPILLEVYITYEFVLFWANSNEGSILSRVQ